MSMAPNPAFKRDAEKREPLNFTLCRTPKILVFSLDIPLLAYT
jgi:hypothetical protein